MSVKIKDGKLREIIREELIMESPIGPMVRNIKRFFVSQLVERGADQGSARRAAESLQSDVLVAVQVRAKEARSAKSDG